MTSRNRPAAFLFTVALALAVQAQAQTRVLWSQLQKPPYEGLDESLWCQGPSLYWADSKQLVIGRNWTVAAPCYVHFNVIPQTSPDPLNVATVRQGATVWIADGNSFDDDLYVWMTPAQAGAIITVGVRSAASIRQCDNCVIVGNQTLPRVFVSGSTPVGMARVTAGLLTQPVHSILQTHQIYLMPGTDMTLGIADGGLTFQVSAPPPPTTQQQIAMLDTARNRAVAAQVQMAAAAPVGQAKLEQMEAQLASNVDELRRNYMDLYGRIGPTTPEMRLAANSLRGMVDEARRISYSAPDRYYDAVRQAVQSATMEQARFLTGLGARVAVPKKATEACSQSQYAMDTKWVYLCIRPDSVASAPPPYGVQWHQPGTWVRMRRAKSW